MSLKYQLQQIPFKWMAPESVIDRYYSSASDVWSFGIMCWEVFSFGQTPYSKMNLNEIVLGLSRGYRMPRPECCPSEVFELICNNVDIDVLDNAVDMLQIRRDAAMLAAGERTATQFRSVACNVGGHNRGADKALIDFHRGNYL